MVGVVLRFDNTHYIFDLDVVDRVRFDSILLERVLVDSQPKPWAVGRRNDAAVFDVEVLEIVDVRACDVSSWIVDVLRENAEFDHRTHWTGGCDVQTRCELDRRTRRMGQEPFVERLSQRCDAH